MPNDTSQTKAPFWSVSPGDIAAKALDATSAVADAQQRIVGQMIEVGSSAATEQLRTWIELQSSAIDAARSALERGSFGALVAEFRQDPLGWYGRAAALSLDGAERALRLLENSTQVVGKSVERVQASAEHANRDMQDAARACASRLCHLYATN